MNNDPLMTLFWIGISIALAKFGPLLGLVLR